MIETWSQESLKNPFYPRQERHPFWLLVFDYFVFVYCKKIQLESVTKKIERMAGTWIPKMPKDSVQKIKK